MSQSRRLVSGAALLAGGQVIAQGSVFLRNLVVVRTLTKLDYGTSATFAITLAFLEALTDFGIFKLLIQARDGDDPKFQATAQALRLLQGFAIALAILLFAPTICALFNVREAVWAFRILALAPLFNASQHFDVHRFQREGRYRPIVSAETVGPLAALGVVCALAPWVKDYSLVLWGILAQTGMNTVVSHLAAERPYRLTFRGPFVLRLLSFGWPLLLNGLLLALIQQGDRVIIGSGETMARQLEEWFGEGWLPSHVFDKEDLALYALGFGLTFIPAQLGVRTLSRLLLPLLSKAQDDPERFRRQYAIGLRLFCVYAAGTASFFVVGGTSAVVLLYSERYRGVEPFLAILGIMHALVVARLGPTTAALALADSKAILFGNLGRVVGVIAAAAVATSGGELRDVALCGVLGTALALTILTLRLRLKHGIPLRSVLSPLGFAVVAVGTAYTLRLWLPVTGEWAWIGLSIAHGLGMFVAARLVFPQVFRHLESLLRRRHGSSDR